MSDSNDQVSRESEDNIEEEEEYEEESSDDGVSFVLDATANQQAAQIAATLSTRAVVNIGNNKNYVAMISTNEILSKGSQNPWEIINPSGIHPKDKTKSIFHYDLSKLEDNVENKPWLAENADITDWFNYGFTEKTWEEYRKKILAEITNKENENVIQTLVNNMGRN